MNDIQKLRKKLGMSQSEFADALRQIPLGKLRLRLGEVRAVDKAEISRWETGDRNPDRLIRRAVEWMEKNL